MLTIRKCEWLCEYIELKGVTFTGEDMNLHNIILRATFRHVYSKGYLRKTRIEAICCTPRGHFFGSRSFHSIMGSNFSSGVEYNIQENILKAGILPRHHSNIVDKSADGALMPEGKIGKPPNILIYTNEQSTEGSVLMDHPSKFIEIKDMLKGIIDHESYTLYRGAFTVLQNEVWIENTELLVVLDDFNPNFGSTVIKYIRSGGKMLSCCSDLNSAVLRSLIDKSSNEKHSKYYHKHLIMDKFGCVLNLNSKYKTMESDPKSIDTSGNFMMCCFSNSDGILISTYTFENASAATFQDLILPEKSVISKILINDMSLKSFKNSNYPSISKQIFIFSRNLEMEASVKNDLDTSNIPTQSKLIDAVGRQDFDIVSGQNTPNIAFSDKKFYDILRTKHLGRVVLYADVMLSTMKLLSAVQRHHGLTTIASIQTQGRGRGGNDWLSPEGCAMFSVSMSVSTNSLLGSHISILQIIVSLSVVDAILDIPGYENLPLKLKWPNDIYYKGETKIGGVLVSSSMMRDVITCNVGVGVNLFNPSPTVCINKIIEAYNACCEANLTTFTKEELIARILNKLEDLMEQFESYGHYSILSQYYSRWLHSETEVTVSSSVQGFHQDEVAKVVGVDKYGFIQVRTNDRKVHSVQPDGNSFDFMKNLILSKS